MPQKTAARLPRTASEGLTLETIVDRALALADAEGLPAVTVRRLAQLLGVTPMALYWHVANKDELLDAMGDRIFADIELDYDGLAGQPWDRQLHAVVTAFVAAFRRHPTCRDLVYRRIFANPIGRGVTEYALGMLRRAGFGPRQTADLATYALQSALMMVSAEPAAEVGQDATEQAARMAEKRAGLAQLPAAEYPFIREMAEDLLHCDELDTYYRFGIDLFVAGARAQLANGQLADDRPADDRS